MYRLVLTATLIVQKFYNDYFFNNNTLAQTGGVELGQMVRMEKDFLEMLDFDVSIGQDEYSEFS